MSFYFATEKNQRMSNEDSFCQMELRMNHEAALQIMAVADGMGGMTDGKYYSKRAIQLWYEELMRLLLSDIFRDQSLSDQIKALQDFSGDVYENINTSLYQMGLDRGNKGGTTLSVALHFWDRWIISNCGDSPVYAIQDGRVSLLSMIQNRADQMVRDGVTRKGSTEYYRNRNRLMEYLGKRDSVHPCVTVIMDKDADYILMGTDGAFGEYDEESLREFFYHKDMDDSRILPALFESVRISGGQDNQTAILFAREDMYDCTYKVVEKQSVTKRIRSKFLRSRK